MILVIGQMISLFGSSIQRFALSLYLLDLTGSATIFASILALSIVPVILLSPFAGIMADRFHKRNVMVILDIISGAVIAMYSVFLFSGRDHYVIVAVMMLILSGISTLYQPSVTASIPLIVEEEYMIRANGIVYQISSLSNFIGPVIAGILYGLVGIKGVVFINGISFFVSAGLEFFLSIPHEKKEKMISPIRTFQLEMKESFSYLKNDNPIIFRVIVTSGLYNLFLVPIFSVGAPVIIKLMFGMSSQAYGISEGVIALGMVLGAMWISRNPGLCKMNRIYLVLYPSCFAMFMMGVSAGLSGTFKGNMIGFVLFTLFGMCIMMSLGIANVISAAYIQSATPNNLLGKVSAFGAAFATMTVPIGQVAFGRLLEIFDQSVSLLVFVAAVCTFLVTLFVRWNVRQIKETNS